MEDQTFEPFKIDDLYDEFAIDNAVLPEERLWRSVIAQAVIDSITPSKKQFQQHAAQTWLYYANKDFKRVCELAGFDASSTHERILDFITNPRVTYDSALKHKSNALSLVA